MSIQKLFKWKKKNEREYIEVLLIELYNINRESFSYRYLNSEHLKGDTEQRISRIWTFFCMFLLWCGKAGICYGPWSIHRIDLFLGKDFYCSISFGNVYIGYTYCYWCPAFINVIHAAFTHSDPESVKIPLRFRDLRAYIERWWNWAQVKVFHLGEEEKKV